MCATTTTDIDLTTLAGDDTAGNVQRLCAKAKSPVRPDILASLGCQSLGITVGAVCVYPARVADAVEALKGTKIPVASVATGFPSGQISHEVTLRGGANSLATDLTLWPRTLLWFF